MIRAAQFLTSESIACADLSNMSLYLCSQNNMIIIINNSLDTKSFASQNDLRMEDR